MFYGRQHNYKLYEAALHYSLKNITNINQKTFILYIFTLVKLKKKKTGLKTLAIKFNLAFVLHAEVCFPPIRVQITTTPVILTNHEEPAVVFHPN